MSELPKLKHYFSNINYSSVICRKDNANLTEAQANKIIRRCDCHDALLTACKDLYNDCRNEPMDKQRGEAMEKAYKAITEVEEKWAMKKFYCPECGKQGCWGFYFYILIILAWGFFIGMLLFG